MSRPRLGAPIMLDRRIARFLRVVAIATLVAGCGMLPADRPQGRIDPRLGVAASPRVVALGAHVPRGGGRAVIGRPYTVAGVTYVPRHDPGYTAVGSASWYGEAFQGRLTANGEVFDANGIMAAHPTMPLPSYARISNLENGRSLVVRVNDRGPFHGRRIVDVSRRAAALLGFQASGVARVRVAYLGPAPLEGSDDRVLVASLETGAGTVPTRGHITPQVRYAGSQEHLAAAVPPLLPPANIP